MSEDPTWSTSRRAFVASGALSTGALIGAAGTSAAVGTEPPGSNTEPVDRGVMYPYQFTPERRFSVLESGIDWRPAGLEDGYRTHVIAYDHAPSYRAFLFTGEGAIEPGRSLEVGRVRGSPRDAGRRFVTVGLASEVGDETDPDDDSRA